MLSETSRETIRATLPAVRPVVEQITAAFYQRMFAAHPEMLRDLFNRGNQANGAQRQALAGAFVGYATALVEHPTTPPAAMLSRIAHKHASLGVTPAQYPIVRRHLMAAIRSVLGPAVTDEVAAAWDEVYWLMAGDLIAAEARLYLTAGVEPAAWRVYQVARRDQETPDVISLLLRPVDGRPAPAGRAGQYVSVRTPLPDGARQIRQYSLSALPAGAIHITVKRVAGDPDGEVSTHLHAHAHVGTTLELSAPFGDMTLDDGDGPLLLASAGIGCTPINAMLAQLAAEGSKRRVILVHADHDERAHALRAAMAEHVASLPNASAHIWYERPVGDWPAERTGLADLDALTIPPGTTAYLCGPIPFLRAAHGHLRRRGLPEASIRHEIFGPDTWLGADPTG